MKGEHRFKKGDKLIVVDEPVMDIDRQHAGKEVTLTSGGYDGAYDRIIYSARFDDGSNEHVIFFDADLRRPGNAGKIEQLKAEIARLEAEESTDRTLDLIKEAPVGSNVFIKPTLYTKVDKDKWRWFYLGGDLVQYHSHSGTKTVVNDVKAALETGADWEFFPADKD